MKEAYYTFVVWQNQLRCYSFTEGDWTIEPFHGEDCFTFSEEKPANWNELINTLNQRYNSGEQLANVCITLIFTQNSPVNDTSNFPQAVQAYQCTRWQVLASVHP